MVSLWFEIRELVETADMNTELATKIDLSNRQQCLIEMYRFLQKELKKIVSLQNQKRINKLRLIAALNVTTDKGDRTKNPTELVYTNDLYASQCTAFLY